MAVGKNTVVVYCDWIHVFDKLSDEEAGQLIKHLFHYVNDKDPEPPNRLLELVFEPLKQQLKSSLKKWEETKTKRAESGRLGGIKSGEARRSKEPKEASASKDEANEANEANASNLKQSKANEANASNPKQAEANEANEAVNVNVNVNDNVNVFKEVVSLWNITCCPPLSKVEKITKSRKDKMRIRLAEMSGDIETVKTIFEKVKNSGFMKGDNVRGWKVTFDWIFENDKNWVKIMEGNYDGNNKANKGSQTTGQPTTMAEYAAKDYDSRF